MKTIKTLVENASSITIFSGAGFSTESDIPDFRSENGLYFKNHYPYSNEVMLSHSFFMNQTEMFYRFYRNEMIHESALPNRAHKAVARLEALGKLEAVITQNIDGLHEKAGNRKVITLHGSIYRNYCMNCHTFYGLDKITNTTGIPYCDVCGGIIKPDVVLYEEALDQTMIHKAIHALENSDLLIVAGTSLSVYPAAGLLQYYKGKEIIVINHDETNYDAKATIVTHENIGDVLDFINYM